ncbi:MAG: acyl carrier protein [Spirochaetales bacterium]|nr:acyl carrier protein [Spirochaetales bacterium]
MLKTDDRISKVNELLESVMKNKKVIIPEQNLVDDLNLNSIQFMELIGKIETEYDVIVPVQKLTSIVRVSDLYKVIQNIEEFCS